jgi:protocatechuate 3,4-dioxygenase alpha subunit
VGRRPRSEARADRRSTLLTTQDENGPVTGYRFDVHLQGERETVFLAYPRHER